MYSGEIIHRGNRVWRKSFGEIVLYIERKKS